MDQILLDPQDQFLLGLHGWYILRDGHKSYAYANTFTPEGKPTTVKLHRLVLGLGRGDQDTLVDHANGNGLDNRRSNLRIATRAQNQANSGSRPGSSKHKGVYLHMQRKNGNVTTSWRAMIRLDGRRKSLGYYKDEDDAGRAYDQAALEHFGEFALLNFPTTEALHSEE